MTWAAKLNSTPRGGYRPDIDGLRALAVLPVVWFHVDLPFLTGGFVGVDIFFVISGYLITGIIFREVKEQRFSYLGFYERRMRRIFPALLAMITTTLAVGYFALFPSEYTSLATSSIYGTLSVANIYFYKTTSYFSGDEFPLLHVWSLAVEEQFYLTFPPVLFLIWHRFRRHMTAVLAVLFLLSLLASQCAVARDPSAVFYLPQYRFWELMCGGLLAISGREPPRSAWVREGLAFAGLLLILGSIVLLNRATAFPGFAALPVCLGTTLLLGTTSSTRSTLVSFVLRQYPVRLVVLA